MELLDGMLVSFTYTRNVYKGEGLPYQVLVRADEQGGAHVVARRPLTSGRPVSPMPWPGCAALQ